jgi:ankyrin repeat protein
MSTVQNSLLEEIRSAEANLTETASGPQNISVAWEINDAVFDLMKTCSTAEFIDLVRRRQIPTVGTGTFGSLISLAVRIERPELIIPLIAEGCDVQTPDFEDSTPLERVISHCTGKEGVAPALALLEAGASLSDNYDVMGFAATCGNAGVVGALLQKGYDANKRCPKRGDTPLSAALWSLELGDGASTVKVLLEHGAACNDNSQIQTNRRQPIAQRAQQALQVVCERLLVAKKTPQLDSLIDVLIDEGAQINDTEGNASPLTTAIAKRNDAVAHALLEHGANPLRIASIGSETALQQAALLGLSKTVGYLVLHYDEDPLQMLPDGRPLIDAVTNKETLAILHSVRAGAVVDDAIAQAATELGSRPRTGISPAL